MSNVHTRPIRDIRLEVAHSYHQVQDDTYRTPVEVLEAKYAPLVERFKDEKKTTLKLTKWRGSKCIVKSIILTDVVRRKLNRYMPKIRGLSQKKGGFLIGDFAELLEVHRVAAHKYLNILLASGLIVSDGRPWAAEYRWNPESKKSCL